MVCLEGQISLSTQSFGSCENISAKMSVLPPYITCSPVHFIHEWKRLYKKLNHLSADHAAIYYQYHRLCNLGNKMFGQLGNCYYVTWCARYLCSSKAF